MMKIAALEIGRENQISKRMVRIFEDNVMPFEALTHLSIGGAILQWDLYYPALPLFQRLSPGLKWEEKVNLKP